MARPKGVIQERDVTKYWLPEGVNLAPHPPLLYRKDTHLIFIDEIHGEFISSYRAIQNANASTHPEAVKSRRSETNIERYGGTNPHNSAEVRSKFKKTMLEKYGTETALSNPKFLKKSQDTLESNYGVRNTMHSSEIRKTLEENNIVKFGVGNPMQNVEVQQKLKNSNLALYGVENPGGLPASVEKAFKTMEKNGSGRLSSKGELEILEFVKSLGIDADKGYIGGASPKELDIKIKEKNMAIEFNGVYWHSERIKNFDKNSHLNKMLICKEQGYKLLQFFDFEWNERKDQVKSFLTSALGKNQTKIHGRKTELKEVPKSEAKDFLNKYHILGSCNFKTALGLYHNNELVAMITLGVHHRNNKEIVLSRYVGKCNVSVRGGLQKLTKRAFELYGPITTWIDLRMSDGESWLKTGWNKLNTLPPDYFYYNSSDGSIISKQARQKKKIKTPVGMTEREHAKKDGLYRVYDCGKLKLVYNG